MNIFSEIEDILQSVTYFAHLLSHVLMEGKATSNASPNIELGDSKFFVVFIYNVIYIIYSEGRMYKKYACWIRMGLIRRC